MWRHCRHVGGQKQYIFSPLGNKTIFMQNCFIVSALQHGRRENLWACPQCHPTTIADTLQEFELLSHQTCCSNVKPLIHKSNFSFIKSKVALLWVLASARDFALLYWSGLWRTLSLWQAIQQPRGQTVYFTSAQKPLKKFKYSAQLPTIIEKLDYEQYTWYDMGTLNTIPS